MAPVRHTKKFMNTMCLVCSPLPIHQSCSTPTAGQTLRYSTASLVSRVAEKSPEIITGRAHGKFGENIRTDRLEAELPYTDLELYLTTPTTPELDPQTRMQH